MYESSFSYFPYNFLGVSRFTEFRGTHAEAPVKDLGKSHGVAVAHFRGNHADGIVRVGKQGRRFLHPVIHEIFFRRYSKSLFEDAVQIIAADAYAPAPYPSDQTYGQDQFL